MHILRTPIALFAGLLVFSHAFAADNVIRLSKPLKLELPAKAAGAEPDKAATADKPADKVVKTDTPAGASASASASAAAKLEDLSPEERAQQELAQKIKVRLEALRAKNGGKPAPVVMTPFINRNAYIARPKVKPAVQEQHASHWSYEGDEGPANWGKMDSNWKQCASGQRQSPIDIKEGIKVDLEPIQFDYRPANFKVIDNGHTVQVDLEPGNRIILTGRIYELVQFHFHRPAEERVDGKSFQMVVHLVHKSEDGKLAVVALLVDQGATNNLIQNVWNNLPLEKNDPVAPLFQLDPTQLLPMMRYYYTYMGSLTTPPCTENVLWIVMKQPIRMSPEQIAIFARLYPMNARPIQANAGRIIKESN